jgi:hypothetical protein
MAFGGLIVMWPAAERVRVASRYAASREVPTAPGIPAGELVNA